MIYFSDKPIKYWQPNLIMLDLEDDLGHVYVSRNTYDQAVIISDRFSHDVELVSQKLGVGRGQEDIASYMTAILPRPLNILSPFYNLIDSSVRIDEEDMKQAIGVLSYISMSIDFNMMLKVPFEVRSNLVFTKSILIDYQGHFEDFNFKVSDPERHIVPEEGEKQVTEIPRGERENFTLEEEQEEEQFDLDSFLDDIGWNDVDIPDISASVESASNEESSKDNEERTILDEKVSEASGYESIIGKYSI